MNVLIINPILATPTAEGLQRPVSIKNTMIYGMARGFLQAGHTPTLIAAEDYRPVNEEEYEFEVLFMPTSLQKVFKPTLLPFMSTFGSWLRKNSGRFDLIIAKECFSVATLQACRVCPEKILIWQELNAHQRKFFRIPSRLWHNLIARLFMRHVKVVGCSHAARDFISHYLPETVDETIEHGIDSDKFRPCEQNEKQRRLISSSQLIERKNVGSIIRKFAVLHAMQGYDDIELAVCGAGVLREELEKLTTQLGLDDCVKFLGFLPGNELGKIVSHSLAFLVDTRADLNVISIVESVAAGTPVITNCVPLTAPWINTEGLGIARDGWNASDMVKVIDNNSEYSSNCRVAAETLSAESVARRLVSIGAFPK